MNPFDIFLKPPKSKRHTKFHSKYRFRYMVVRSKKFDLNYSITVAYYLISIFALSLFIRIGNIALFSMAEIKPMRVAQYADGIHLPKQEGAIKICSSIRWFLIVTITKDGTIEFDNIKKNELSDLNGFLESFAKRFFDEYDRGAVLYVDRETKMGPVLDTIKLLKNAGFRRIEFATSLHDNTHL